MKARSQDEIELPTTLGRYQLLAKIASGGAAAVYLARMTGKAGFARTVAVKVLHRHLASDPELVAMFLDEARLSARISHPNVVDVYDVDALSGRLIIVMEYVEGAAFSEVRGRYRRRKLLLPLGLVLRVVHDALLGLHAAHELRDERGVPLNLVHRDISPHNILLGVDGLVRVTDFGIAKARGRIATTMSTNVVKGKLRYLAPEQFIQEGVDRRVDLFAAGIVLWEGLTGKSLFSRGTDSATLAAILNAPIPPPSELRAEIPNAVDEICLKALSRDVETRFQSAADFAEALERAVATMFFPARQTGALVAEIAHESLDRIQLAVSEAADQVSDLTPSVTSGVPLREALAASLAGDAHEPGRVSLEGLSPPSEPSMPAYSPPMRRGRWLVPAAAAAVVVGGLGGWAFVRSRGPDPGAAPSAMPADAQEPMSPEATGSETSTESLSGAATTASAESTEPLDGGPTADAAGDAAKDDAGSRPPRRWTGGGKKRDKLYWPDQP